MKTGCFTQNSYYYMHPNKHAVWTQVNYATLHAGLRPLRSAFCCSFPYAVRLEAGTRVRTSTR